MTASDGIQLKSLAAALVTMGGGGLMSPRSTTG
jgi:hypothetical protein